MEVRGKKKTLAGLFLKYVALFCVNTILLVGGAFLLLQCASALGMVLPANYAETKLSENVEQIRKGGESLEKWIPKGCTYGVYSAKGEYLSGNFSCQEQKNGWIQYKKDNVYAANRGYYRFVYLDDGKVCIVKYHLLMRYSSERLNDLLPAPETLMLILDVILFFSNVILISGRFARKVKAELQGLRIITEKIAGNDLEFETKNSNIKEVDEVMDSLGRMKDVLKESLKVQWDMENQKQEQLSALAHDIKTPLTIIKGNTELLEESNLSEENEECVESVLMNVNAIEEYLETMVQVLRGENENDYRTVLSCGRMKEIFCEMAKQLSAAEKIPVSFTSESLIGEVCCNEACIMRAWSNIVSNAAEHTDRQKGIYIMFKQKCREKQSYLVASVRDYGSGFSEKDLQYADREFYSGDASRHDRSHQGLGLAIAKKFAKEQDGFLEYGNSVSGTGAEVALWVRVRTRTQDNNYDQGALLVF